MSTPSFVDTLVDLSNELPDLTLQDFLEVGRLQEAAYEAFPTDAAKRKVLFLGIAQLIKMDIAKSQYLRNSAETAEAEFLSAVEELVIFHEESEG